MVFVSLKVSLAKGEYLKMIYRQLNKLDEKDFAVLRGPLESGRQSPKSIGRILILSVFLQTLLFFLTYVVAADHTKFPFKDILFYLHLVGTTILLNDGNSVQRSNRKKMIDVYRFSCTIKCERLQ